MSCRLKRVYDDAAKADDWRPLVDRVWPGGLTKREAKVDDWLKEIAHSTRLRKWFGHDRARWTEFKKRHAAELKDHREPLEQLAQGQTADDHSALWRTGRCAQQPRRLSGLREYIKARIK